MANIVWNPAQPPFGGSRIIDELMKPSPAAAGSSAAGAIADPQNPGQLDGHAEITVTSARGMALARMERVAHFPFIIQNAAGATAPGVVSTSLTTAGAMQAGVGVGRRNQAAVTLPSFVVAGYSLFAVIEHLETATRYYEYSNTDFKRLKSPDAVAVANPGGFGGNPVQASNRDVAHFFPSNTKFANFTVDGNYILTMALTLWASGFADQADQYLDAATGASRIDTQAPFRVEISLL